MPGWINQNIDPFIVERNKHAQSNLPVPRQPDYHSGPYH